MNLDYSPQEEEFRASVRAFIARALPPETAHRMLAGQSVTAEEITAWQKALHAQGWGAPNWSTEFGGTGWTAVEQFIFEEETAAAGAPRTLPFGLKMVAPVIQAFGNEAQKKKFLPRIASGEDWWCQGYSEPGSGSDLASLRTKAERVGDYYVVNGQKTWNTLGQYADWIFCLVRTDATVKPQLGISFLLIDMKSKGVSVRPIKLVEGGAEVNEIWFDNVEVPVENLVGEENKGWTYAKFLLGHERVNIADVGGSKRELTELKEVAAHELKNGRPLKDDPYFSRRIAEIEIALQILEVTNLRVAAAGKSSSANSAASILKIRGSEITQAISELKLEAFGQNALAYDYGVVVGKQATNESDPTANSAAPAGYLNRRKTTIYGGSNEIQKNIIAQMVLGLS